MKGKKSLFGILLLCLTLAVCSLTGCEWDKPKTVKITNETELATYMAEGFKNKVDKKEVEKYVIASDITVTRTDIVNYSTVVYEQQLSYGETEEEARDSKGGVKDLILDGQNHTIKNLTLDGFRASFLGRVSGSVTIKDLTFDNLTVTGKAETAGIASYLTDGATLTLDNVKIINSTITCSEEYAVGGFVGYSEKATGTIKNCSLENSTVTAQSATACGGFIGSMLAIRDEFITLDGDESNGNTITGNENVGGFVGKFKHEYEENKADRLIEFKNLTNGSSVLGAKRVGGIMGLLAYWDFGNFTFTNCANEFADGEDREIRATTQSAGGILGSADWEGSAFRIPSGSQINFVSCSNDIAISSNECVGGISGGLDDKFWKVSYSDCKNFAHGSIYGGNKLGGISGSIEGAILGAQQFTFSDCVNNAFVTGNGEYVGGISGYNDKLNPLFTSCVSSSQTNWITGLKFVGGISGRYGTFVSCQNSMAIKSNGGEQVSWTYVGGIVGSGEGSSFTDCVNSGDLLDKNSQTTAKFIGGIAGYTNQLVLSGCSNSGTISGSDCVGGLVGKSDATWAVSPKNTLINCSNTGSIYAFGQTTTDSAYDNDDDDDIVGKVGLMIGSFHTGTIIFEFTGCTVNGSIYLIKDSDFVGGWCGYFDEGDVETLISDISTSTISYKIYFSESVSESCKTKLKYGEKIFDKEVNGFNNPVATENFTYSAQ